MKYLKEILLAKKKETAGLKESYKGMPLLETHSAVMQKRNKGHFLENIKKGKVNIIAEIKKASPSRGVITGGVDIEKNGFI